MNRDASVLTWKLLGLFELNDQVNVFVRVTKGHPAPSAQGRLLFQDEISIGETETHHSLEFGLKSMLMDKRLRLNATAFSYLVDDFQVTKIGGAASLSESASRRLRQPSPQKLISTQIQYVASMAFRHHRKQHVSSFRFSNQP